MLPVRNRNEETSPRPWRPPGAERRVEFALLTVQQEVAAASTQYDAAQRSLEVYERACAAWRAGTSRWFGAYALGRGSLLDVIAEQRRTSRLRMATRTP